MEPIPDTARVVKNLRLDTSWVLEENLLLLNEYGNETPKDILLYP